MKTRLASMAAVLFATVGTAALSPAADSFKLDSVHSGVVFRVHHMVSNVFGIFHGPEGTVTVDAGVPAFDVTLPVEKLDMGNEKWAADMKAASWFDVKQFPTITLKSTAVKKTADDTFEVIADLTLHGVTKSITVTVNKTGEGKGMQGETRIGYDATFKIKRSDYGMTTYVGPIGDEVTLMVNVEAIKQ